MGTDTVVTVRMLMAAGPLTRGEDAMVGEVVAVAVVDFPLRSGVR